MLLLIWISIQFASSEKNVFFGHSLKETVRTVKYLQSSNYESWWWDSLLSIDFGPCTAGDTFLRRNTCWKIECLKILSLFSNLDYEKKDLINEALKLFRITSKVMMKLSTVSYHIFNCIFCYLNEYDHSKIINKAMISNYSTLLIQRPWEGKQEHPSLVHRKWLEFIPQSLSSRFKNVWEIYYLYSVEE